MARSYLNFDFGLNWKWRYATTGEGGTDFYNPEGKNTKVSGSGFGASGFDLGWFGPTLSVLNWEQF